MSNPLNRSELSDISSDKPDQSGFSVVDLISRVDSALKGRTDAWLSRKSGISSSALSDMRKKFTTPRADNAIKMARALEVSLEWLLTGTEGGGGDKGASDDLDLVPVHEIDLAYGMGGTYSDSEHVQAEVLHFPRPWLERITRTPPSQLTFARGRGDSMVPTLMDGDIILIDRSQRTIHEQDAIWALNVGHIAMIKRIRIMRDTITILSDNDRVPDAVASEDEVNIVGRVIFIGRKL
ncbi:LexA family transcriptional regulator [Sphingomonas hengshuiensis]|uniref:LexA family transcriptional regulator n=1 Tax=Sphingomonas hengshuiensis TaxID=1609977 RepID=UPI001D0F76D5|nr:XRE family transcriptional regulator [Sphingomonas hengshuiensis]